LASKASGSTQFFDKKLLVNQLILIKLKLFDSIHHFNIFHFLKLRILFGLLKFHLFELLEGWAYQTKLKNRKIQAKKLKN
jgi:hypothetical protein